MNTLLEYNQKRKKRIQQQLHKKNTPSEIVDIIQDEINALRDEYIGQLTQSQEYIASKGLKQTLDWIRLLKAVKVHESPKDQQQSTSTARRK